MMMVFNRYCLVVFIAVLSLSGLMGQVPDSSGWGTNYPAVMERLLVESKWKYTYTLHLESNTVVHQSGKQYEYFLFFRYDYTWQQYLNGQLSQGIWGLNGSELFYTFKFVSKFEIARCDREKLVLEFTQPNAKGHYQYHFVRVESKDAPFKRRPNELPEVLVESSRKPAPKKWGWYSTKDSKKERKRRKEAVADKPFIQIELIGGGYYGGIDPVQRDFIQIKTDGRLVQEFKSAEHGVVKKTGFIPREELEQFVQWAENQQFFEMSQIYDCSSSDCFKRKSQKPVPVPVRIVIAHGARRKVVQVSIYGRDDRKEKYISYPPALDHIISAIQRFAQRTS